jgi:hypothetical protein
MRALVTKRGYMPSGTILNLDPADQELVFVKFLTPSDASMRSSRSR